MDSLQFKPFLAVAQGLFVAPCFWHNCYVVMCFAEAHFLLCICFSLSEVDRAGATDPFSLTVYQKALLSTRLMIGCKSCIWLGQWFWQLPLVYCIPPLAFWSLSAELLVEFAHSPSPPGGVLALTWIHWG